ncbi:hypothetical protein [Simkania sp.]|uniref:hypothetical protein n=1 Tax=Simkania sp. TaxID=34094 RepID=UPI003B51F875
MQINYYITPEHHLLFYNWTLASRHYQAAQATPDKVDELARNRIISPKKIPSQNWIFHYAWAILDFIPIIGLFFAILDHALNNYDRFAPSLQPKNPPPLKQTPPHLPPSPKPTPSTSFEAFLKKLASLEKEGFFDKKGQEIAKKAFKEVMAEQGLEVSYVTAEGWDHTLPQEPLDPNIFHWSITRGVEKDIPKAGKDSKRVHLFSAASQYNAAEAPGPYTPPIGKAMIKSEFDHTQGPLAQRTNPLAFECVTAYLTHLGFNMMEKALPSAGTTYTDGSAIQHGYLCPTNASVSQLADELEQNFEKYKAPCYESRVSGATESVYLILGAAPAFGYSYNLDKGSEACRKLQYWSYVANFTAQFKQTLELLKKSPDKEVVLHITGIGLGVFGSKDPELANRFNQTFADALKHTGSLFQKQLNKEDRGRVHVQLESYNGTDALQSVCTDHLKFGPPAPRL